MLLGCGWLGELNQLTPEQKKAWEAVFDPATRLPRSKTPLYIATGSDDGAYWLPGVNATYNDHGGDKRLTVIPNFDHALTPDVDEQIFAWLDYHLKGKGSPFPTVGNPTASVEQGKLRLAFDASQPTESAFVCVSYGPAGWWPSRVWHTVSAERGADGRWSAFVPTPMPDQPVFCYANAVEAGTHKLVSSAIVSFLPKEMGVNTSSAWPKTNGFLWGDSEPEGIRTANLMYWPGLVVDETVAHSGRSSLKIDASGSKEPVEFMLRHGRVQPLVTNLLRVWLKADRDDVEVKLTFDESVRTVRVGTEWKQFSLWADPLPAADRLNITVTVPGGRIVWLDDAWLGASAALQTH
jgi:hypothetical protein